MGCNVSKEKEGGAAGGDKAAAAKSKGVVSSSPSKTAVVATASTPKAALGKLTAKLWSEERAARGEWQARLAKADLAALPVVARDEAVVRQLLLGAPVSEQDLGRLGGKRPAVRFFLSSTFTDTELERNLIIEDVHPYLRELGERLHVQVYQSSEMRWGIRADASASHQTSAICMAEIRRCQEESAGLSYVLMLCDKYGFRPFPAMIPSAEFDQLLAALPADEAETAAAQSFANDWYVEDKNAVPPMRMLRPVGKDENAEFWGEVFPALQTAFRKAAAAAGLSPERRALYEQSVTAEEVANGLLELPAERREKEVLVYSRRLENIDAAHAKAGLWQDMQRDGTVDADAQARLATLRDETVPPLVPAQRRQAYTLPWGPGLDLDGRSEHQDYLRHFTNHFCAALASNIEEVAARFHFAPDELVDEVATHAKTALERQAGFVPTASADAVFDKAESHVAARLASTSPGGVFAVCGVSGSGKTSLMAELQRRLKSTNEAAAMAVRFLGTSRDTGTARQVMSSLYVHLHRIYTNAEPSRPPSADMEVLMSQFQRALALATPQQPLILVLDSLDQLSDAEGGRSLAWLPLGKVPKHVAIVVSTLPDVGGCWQVLQQTSSDLAACSAQVAPLATGDGKALLKHWLDAAQRTLTGGQEEAVLAAFEKCPTPLFLRILVTGFASKWRSDEDIRAADIPTTVPDLLNKLFDKLEVDHGKPVVEACLGYLSMAKIGLSDSEMEDLLSLNDDVLTAVFEWWLPPVRRIPPLIWTRIVSDLPGALVERGAGAGISVRTWYHRQYREAAERRYAAPARVKLASDLADYFSGRWVAGKPISVSSDELRQAAAKAGVDLDGGAVDRKVARMSTLIRGRLDSQLVPPQFNVRKLTELPQHLLVAERKEELEALLTDLEFVESKNRAGLAYELAGDYAAATAAFGSSAALTAWGNFVTTNIHIFATLGEATFARAQMVPDGEGVAEAAVARWEAGLDCRARVGLVNKQADPQLGIYKGQTGSNKSCCFSPDGSLVLAGNEKSEFRAWSTQTGQLKTKIVRPKTGTIYGVVALDNEQALLAAKHVVTLVSLTTGAELRQVEVGLGEGENISVLKETRGQEGVIALATVSTIMLLDRETLEVTSRLALPSHLVVKMVNDVCLTAEAAIVGMGDGNLVWIKRSGKQLELVEGSEGGLLRARQFPAGNYGRPAVSSVVASADGQRVYALVSSAIHVLDGASGETLSEHKLDSMVSSIDLVKGGQALAAAMWDDTVTLVSVDDFRVLRKLSSASTGVLGVSRDERFIASCGANYYHITAFDLDRVDISKPPPLFVKTWSMPAVLERGAGEEPLLVCGGALDRLKMCDMRTGGFVGEIALGEGKKRVQRLAASPDGRWIAAVVDGRKVCVWHSSGGGGGGSSGEGNFGGFEVKIAEVELMGRESTPELGFSPCSSFLAGWDEDGGLFFLNVATGAVAFDCDGSRKKAEEMGGRAHNSTINSLEWVPEGLPGVDGLCALTASDDETVRVWQVGQGENVGTLSDHSDQVSAAVLGTKNRMASAAEENNVWIWELSAGDGSSTAERVVGKVTHRLPPVEPDRPNNNVTNAIRLLWPRQADVLISASPNRLVRIWNVDTGEPLHTLDRTAARLVVMPGEKLLAFPIGGGLQLVRLADGQNVTKLLGHDTTQGTGRTVVSAGGRFLSTRWGDNAVLTHDLSKIA